MEIKFIFPTHEQNQYVVECVERSSFDPKQNWNGNKFSYFTSL